MAFRIPNYLKNTLNDTGLPWDIQEKRRHSFIRICGQVVLAVPNHSGMKEQRKSRHPQNNIATIKRFAKQIKGN